MKIYEIAKRKDSDAFETLMRGELPGMYRIARSMLQNDEDAADAIQDTMLKCWEKMGTVKDFSFFRTWLTKILINNCNDILRKRKPTVTYDEIPEIPTVDDYFTDSWKEIVAGIDEKYRVVIELFYIEEFSTREIAKILKISEANVRSRLSRGRKQLEKFITDSYEEETHEYRYDEHRKIYGNQ